MHSDHSGHDIRGWQRRTSSASDPPYSHHPAGDPQQQHDPRESYEPRSGPTYSQSHPEMSHASYGSSGDNSAHGQSRRASDSSSTNKPPRKRKKQFKYMLEHSNQEEKPSVADEGEQEGNPEGNEGRKESRKKVKKACIFCKRSHMPCEEARPCKRCVKRGIPELCRDAEPANESGKGSASNAAASSSRRSDASEGKDKEQDELESGSEVESPASTSASASASVPATSTLPPIPGASARDPDFKPMMPISVLLSPADAMNRKTDENSPFTSGSRRTEAEDSRMQRVSSSNSVAAPSRYTVRGGKGSGEATYSPTALSDQSAAWDRNLDLPTQQKMIRMLEAGPAALDLDDIFGDKPISLLTAPSMVGLPVGDPLLRPSAADASRLRAQDQRYDPRHGINNVAASGSSSNDILSRPKHLLHEEIATTSELRGIQTYSYTYGYAKLARWMQTRFSRRSCESVDRTLGMIRPRLLAISRSLPESELVEVEESFNRLVHHYQANVLEFSPVPMFVCRRTGEIYGANEHACKLMQLPKSIFEGGQISHFQTITEQDTVEMWKLYAQECMGNLRDPPSRVCTMEIDRSLLLYNKPGFDPRTGELLGDGSGLCDDGKPSVIRKKIVVTFEAKISKHGLPILVCATYTVLPVEEPPSPPQGPARYPAPI